MKSKIRKINKIDKTLRSSIRTFPTYVLKTFGKHQDVKWLRPSVDIGYIHKCKNCPFELV